MKRTMLLAWLLTMNAGIALAQPTDHADMAAQPLLVEDLPKGTVTVRVGRGSLANVAVGVAIKATLIAPDGKVSERSENTQADGRATFSDLPAGNQFRAQTVVDGQPMQTAIFTIPAEGGARLMLVSSAGPSPEDDDDARPSMPPAQGNPHGAGHGQMRPEAAPVMLLGQVEPKPGLPPGTLELRLLDAQGAPVAQQEARLGRMVKPEQGAVWITGVTDAKGETRFSRLLTDDEQSYIALYEREGMRLGSPLFKMPKDSGMAGELRIPGRSKDASVLKIAPESKIMIDLREDKLEIMENLIILNTSDQMFQSEHGGLTIPLPAEASDAEGIAGGSPLEGAPGAGLLLRQAIAPSLPGQMPSQARFGFFFPLAGEKSVTIRQPMPLGLEGAVVMIPMVSGLTLQAPGLTELPPQEDDRGGQLRLYQLASVPRNGVLTLTLSGLPARSGLGKSVAGLLAALLFVGAVLGVRRPKSADQAVRKRETLLAELVELERARKMAPDVGLDDKRARLLEALVALDAEPHG